MCHLQYTTRMINVTRGIALDESEIQEEFIRASGPGGTSAALAYGSETLTCRNEINKEQSV